MKILLVCNKSPWPPKDGGASATLSMAESLAANGAEVTVLAMNTSRHPVNKNDIPEDLKKQIEFHLVDINTSIKLLPALIDFFIPGTPYFAKRFISGEFSDRLLRLVKSQKYDIIQFEGLYALQYQDQIRQAGSFRIACRPHNAEHKIWEGLSKNTKNLFKKVYFRRLGLKIKKLEKKLINSCDLLVPISNSDLNTFRLMGNNQPAFVAAYGRNPGEMPPWNQMPDRNLFFIGALDWLPNQEGLEWFLKKVWPLVQIKHPGVSLKIAGRNIAAPFRQLLQRHGAVWAGEVDDAGKYMQKNGILIVPLFSGSGMRVKIIDAMFYRKPVIATSIAAKGIPATNRENILIADTAEEFALAIDSLLTDEAYTNKIAENAGLFALANFNNFDIAKALIQFYKAE